MLENINMKNIKFSFLNPKKLRNEQEIMWVILGRIVLIGFVLLILLSSYDVVSGTQQTTSITTDSLLKSSPTYTPIDGHFVKRTTINASEPPFKTNLRYFLSSFATAMLVAGACHCLGIFLGFLFGIPRIVQHTNTANLNSSNKATYSHNDNLAQISDWITKIIVGVGLTQLSNLPHFLIKIGLQLSASFPGHTITTGTAVNAAISTILYFSISGFLMSYLWTSIYFTNILSNQDANSNPQKGKWGGNAKVNDRELSALVVAQDKATQLYDVTVAVASTDQTNNPLTGVVIFYYPFDVNNGVQAIKAVEGKAVVSLKIDPSNLYTIGAECDEGDTKLELDLENLKALFK